MRTFIIDSDNDITIFASEQQAKASDATGAEAFTSQEELTKLAAAWPGGRLVEIWNSLTGVDPVKKFTDRKTAIARIWKAIQSLQPASAEAQETAAPAHDVGKRRAAKPKSSTKAKREKIVARGPSVAREGSKTEQVVTLLKRKNGATLDELVKLTGWKANSVYGYLSGTIGKKMGLKVQSSKREDGKRLYQIAS